MLLRFLCGIAAIAVLYFILHKISFFQENIVPFMARRKKLDKFLTAFMIVLAFVNIYLPDLWGSRFIENPAWLYNVHDPVFSVVRLFSAAMVVTIPIAIHYQRKTFSRFVVFFGLPTFLANCLYYDKYMYYYQNPEFVPFTELARPFMTNYAFRASFFVILELCKLCLIMRVLCSQRDKLRFQGKADFGKFLLYSLPLLFVNMPIAFPSQLFGSFFPAVVLSSCNVVNILWIAVIVLLIVLLTHLFKSRPYEDKYILLVVLSMSLLFQYASFIQGSDYTMIVRLPFQLCNFACFFLPIALLANKRSLLCFASIANVIGAIAAVVICDTPGSAGLFYTLNVHYMIEHTGIIVIGFLLLTLGIITPLQKNDFLSVWKIFNVYFLLVLVLGTVFNAIHVANNMEPVVISLDPAVSIDFHCNYLFMFLEDVVVDTVPALAVLYRTSLPLGSYAKLQLSELVMYGIFSLICVGPFFAFSAIFKDKKKSAASDSVGDHP